MHPSENGQPLYLHAIRLGLKGLHVPMSLWHGTVRNWWMQIMSPAEALCHVFGGDLMWPSVEWEMSKFGSKSSPRRTSAPAPRVYCVALGFIGVVNTTDRLLDRISSGPLVEPLER